MALYNVVNSKSVPGGVESAYVVTNGVGKARKLFADRYGAAVADLIVERVDTEAKPEPYVLATWDDERPAQRADAVDESSYNDTLADMTDAPTPNLYNDMF